MFSRRKKQAMYGFFPNGLEQYPDQSTLRYSDYSFRQQPNFYPYPPPPIEWNPNLYYNQPLQPGFVNYTSLGQGINRPGAMPFIGPTSVMSPPYSLNIFQNPLQPLDQPQPYYYPNPVNNVANIYPNQYPKNAFNVKQPSGISSVMNSFKAQDGSVDINKMINTAGQMMNAVSQVSSMVKGLGGVLKV